MTDPMGIFRTTIEVAPLHDATNRRTLTSVMVDTKSEYNWPGIAVFAQPGDMILLGAHGLEGMNLRVDLVRRELVPAGPVPAAASLTAL